MTEIRDYQLQLKGFSPDVVVQQYQEQTPLSAEDFIIEELTKLTKQPIDDELVSKYLAIEDVIMTYPPNESKIDIVYGLLDTMNEILFPDNDDEDVISFNSTSTDTLVIANITATSDDIDYQSNSSNDDDDDETKLRLNKITDKIGDQFIILGNKIKNIKKL